MNNHFLSLIISLILFLYKYISKYISSLLRYPLKLSLTVMPTILSSIKRPGVSLTLASILTKLEVSKTDGKSNKFDLKYILDNKV